MTKKGCGGPTRPQYSFALGESLVSRLLIVSFVALAVACSSDHESTDSAHRKSLPTQGYVLTDFRLVLPGAGPEDCPEGFNRDERSLFVDSLPPDEYAKLEENPRGYLAEKVPLYFEDPNKDPCANPSAFEDPGFHTIDRPLALKRLEADGSVSQQLAPAGSCPTSKDFYSTVAESPIDHQYWRVLGCIRGYQPGDQIDSYANTHIKDGSLTILLEVKGPPGGGDGKVEIGVYSSLDPVPTGAGGEPLPGASLEVTGDPRFHNVAHGRITDGVLTTDPFDLRIMRTAQRVDSEYYLRDARLRLELQPDGTAVGFLGGYYDIKWLAHGSIRFEDRTGRSSGGAAAETLGYTCPGKYYAVKRLADGHPDPETGDCTSISTLFSLQAAPAFVLWPNSETDRQAMNPAASGLAP